MNRFRNIVLFDEHSPAYNLPFNLAVLNYIEQNRDIIKSIVHGGDFLNASPISRHSKGKIVPTTLGQDYETANKLLDAFDMASGSGVETVFMYGNHEAWYDQKLKDPEFAKLGTACLNIENGLKLKERGYKIYYNCKKDFHIIGDLGICHGFYVNEFNAKKHLLKFQMNFACGHGHREQLYCDGKHRAYSIGVMADMNNDCFFEYTDIAGTGGWAESLLIADEFEGRTTQQIIVWMGDHIVVDGKVYR